jgi:uncharacterized protein (DUF58 family)
MTGRTAQSPSEIASRKATPKLGAYTALAGMGLLAALVVGRPELAALAAPFALVLVAGLALASEPKIARAAFELDRERALEDETVEATLILRTDRPIGRLELLLDLPEGLETSDGNPTIVHLDWDGRRELDFTLRCARWGGYAVGDFVLRSPEAFGLLVHDWRLELREALKVYPRGEALQRLLRPLETQAFAGNQIPRARGEGIEFADLRPFVPGDRVRRVNWRATARRSEPWVTETHPERNSDVVIFLDTFLEARQRDEGTLDLAVSAAASLATHYLREKDRVGLVSLGGVINWLHVSSGVVQLYRILDSLLDAEIFLSYAWKGIDLLPVRALPPDALVLALSPLLDERAVRTLLDVRARGFDLAVIEISPVPFAPAGRDELDKLARRFWLLRREALRSRYLRLGVPVVEWDADAPLQSALEEVRRFKRHAHFVRA